MVEGNGDDIEQLCKQLEDRFDGYIINKEIDVSGYEGAFSNFQIR